MRIDFSVHLPLPHHFLIDVQLPWTPDPIQQNPVIPPNHITGCPATPLSHVSLSDPSPWSHVKKCFSFIINWLPLCEKVLFALLSHFLCGYTQMHLANCYNGHLLDIFISGFLTHFRFGISSSLIDLKCFMVILAVCLLYSSTTIFCKCSGTEVMTNLAHICWVVSS